MLEKKSITNVYQSIITVFDFSSFLSHSETIWEQTWLKNETRGDVFGQTNHLISHVI